MFLDKMNCISENILTVFHFMLLLRYLILERALEMLLILPASKGSKAVMYFRYSACTVHVFMISAMISHLRLFCTHHLEI